MTREEAIRILNEVIPPPEHHTVDLDHLLIAQAWLCIKEALTAEPKYGHWVEAPMQRTEDLENGNKLYHCSNCNAGDLHAITQAVPYCWKCGAIMGEVEECGR